MVGFIFWQTEVYIEIDRHIEYTKGEPDGNTPKDSPLFHSAMYTIFPKSVFLYSWTSNKGIGFLDYAPFLKEIHHIPIVSWLRTIWTIITVSIKLMFAE